MKIKIYAIGHLKEAYLKQGINEYLKRLEAYTQVEIVEVNDESIVNNPSPTINANRLVILSHFS
ncbi:MAG: 23S rRNA (pseudouridine(1915)-N(3))-methyltransferase RlmH [Bacilli bacterium]|nr:23S rRNA (pseudouridine(1915)-N(3))-methyltransferase RlmH [Bacilli bacterium]